VRNYENSALLACMKKVEWSCL